MSSHGIHSSCYLKSESALVGTTIAALSLFPQVMTKLWTAQDPLRGILLENSKVAFAKVYELYRGGDPAASGFVEESRIVDWWKGLMGSSPELKTMLRGLLTAFKERCPDLFKGSRLAALA